MVADAIARRDALQGLSCALVDGRGALLDPLATTGRLRPLLEGLLGLRLDLLATTGALRSLQKALLSLQ
jgi:hypothetical protein